MLYNTCDVFESQFPIGGGISSFGKVHRVQILKMLYNTCDAFESQLMLLFSFGSHFKLPRLSVYGACDVKATCSNSETLWSVPSSPGPHITGLSATLAAGHARCWPSAAGYLMAPVICSDTGLPFEMSFSNMMGWIRASLPHTGDRRLKNSILGLEKGCQCEHCTEAQSTITITLWRGFKVAS